MEKERLIELLSADNLNEEELKEISELVLEFPWFNLGHFLKLKALKQLDIEPGEHLEKAAVYSSDRRHLYHWINNEMDGSISAIGLMHNELEFVGGDERTETDSPVSGGSDDAFELDADDSTESVEDEILKGFTEKEEVDMEEADVEEDDTFPAMDIIKEKDELDDETDSGEETEMTNVVDRQEELTPIIDNTPLLKETVEVPVDIGKEDETPSLIEQFINNEPGIIKADKPTTLSGDVAAGSVKESDSFITDTLAQIYVKQGLFAKAIYAYERLSLKYPEKSAYFAAQIEKIKNISNS